jgi:hypothetical protein
MSYRTMGSKAGGSLTTYQSLGESIGMGNGRSEWG